MEFWNAPSRRKCGQWSLVIIVVAIGLSSLQAVDAGLGEWRLVTKNAGISAMHAAVAPVLGTVVLLHQTKTGPSNITFPDGRCRNITYDLLLKTVCYVHSVILDPTSEVVRPIMVMTDTQGSSGQFLGEGSLSQTGGDLEGKKRTSNLSTKCYTTVAQRRYCDWVEGDHCRGTPNLHTRELPTYASPSPKAGLINLQLPRDTDDGRGSSPNNLYPFVHLLPTGQLYIFANRDSILYDYNQNVVVRKFDKIPDNPRNYPSGSSSVMLPLVYNDNFKKVEILVCGGAATGSVVMETMPMPRCMGDMVILPNLNVMLINGVKRDYQGWKSGSETILNPVLYNPRKVAGNRFTVLNPTQTPRVYHSTANLLTDGSIMVAGSNTHQYRSFQSMKSNVDFPTELSVKAFMPPYAENKPNSGGRPVIISVNATNVKYRATIESSTGPSPPSPFSPPPMRTVSNPDSFVFTMTSSFWSSHLFSFGQRVVTLNPLNITTQPESRMENGRWVNARTVQLRIPSHYTVLPRTYYMLWVVKNGNPSSSCAWIRIR
uniref:Galactose oxidase-like Early set domain-containing protein n=1 Tax=Physcomitrium patens TaxID=3218 RepID=A0A7I4DR49_PHYPA